jgi:hypothetical protein
MVLPLHVPAQPTVTSRTVAAAAMAICISCLIVVMVAALSRTEVRFSIACNRCFLGRITL